MLTHLTTVPKRGATKPKAVTLNDYSVLKARQYVPLDLSSIIMGFTNSASYDVQCAEWVLTEKDILINIIKKADGLVHYLVGTL